MSLMLAAVDLDRTLIYSRSAWQLKGISVGGADVPDHLVCVEMYNGAPLSYMTRRACDVLRSLRSAAVVVPVTTRTQEQFGRVDLPGDRAGYAITTNGARLLVDGIEDVDWSEAVAAGIAGACAPLDEVLERLAAQSSGWMLRARDAQDVFCYAVIDRAAMPAQALADLRAWCAERNWAVSVQGRKLYCVPEPLTKTAAVAEVARRTGSTVIAAAGDSLLDAGMLEAADVAIRPAHGELAVAGWAPAGLQITAAAGIVAGEQILSWLLDQAWRNAATTCAAPDRTASSSSR